METIKTPTESNIPIDGISTTTFTNNNLYSTPEIIDTIVNVDSIEILYTEHPQYWLSHSKPERRVFKVIYSCVDGKWNVSERIYGTIIEATEETYEFD